jgi:hypothetical protein
LDPTSLNNNHAKLTDLETKVGSLEKDNNRLRLELNELKTKKTLEFLMDLFDKEKKEVLDEAFKKSRPVSVMEGRRACPRLRLTIEPVKIEGGELLALKALARVFLKLQ